VERGWRDRTVGGQLVDHPDKPGTKVLQLRRADESDADGAQWNFPAGFVGEVKVRVMLREGFKGGSIALNDHFFDPSDNTGESKAMFYTHFHPDGAYCSGKLQIGRWQEISLKWNTQEQFCEVSIEGKTVMSLPQLEPTRNGIGYLRLRSASKEKDVAGFLVEAVRAQIEAP